MWYINVVFSVKSQNNNNHLLYLKMVDGLVCFTVDKLDVLKKNCKRNFVKFLKLFIIWCMLLCLGSFLFIYIEECLRSDPKPLNSLQKTWSKACQLVLENNSTTNTTLNTTLEHELVSLCVKEGWQFADDRRCVYDLKNIAKYLDYVYTIAFTIGFGHIVPYSDLGKIVTMLYSLPTIGLTLIIYSYAGDALLIGTQILTALFEKRVLRKKTVIFCKYKLCFIQVVITLILFFVTGGLLMVDQKLSILDCYYFTFISITTIGFGDIVYDSAESIENVWLYLPRLVVFFLVMASMASTFSAVNDVLKESSIKKILSARKMSRKETYKQNDKNDNKY